MTISASMTLTFTLERYEGRGREQVRRGRDGRAQLIVEQGGELDVNNELMKVVEHGYLEVVRFLVEECNADINAKNDGGLTALMMAIGEGRLDVARYLVKECGSDANAKANGDFTALVYAVFSGRLDVVRFLAEDCGADVNVNNKYAGTALMLAAEEGYLDVVRFLIKDCGANVDVKANNGDTALMRAAGGGRLDVVLFLIKDAGADVNLKDNNGDTALMRATGGGDLDVVRFLIKDCVADIDVKDHNGGTALMRAAGGGHLDVVRFLIKDCCADVNVKDDNGGTALMRAARGVYLNVVGFLFKDCGAGVNVKDDNGDTALMRAAEGGHLDVVRFLIKDSDADVNTKNNDGVSAIRIAADHGHTDIVGGLTPFVLPQRQMPTSDTWKDLSNVSTAESLSSYIPPTEVEVGAFYEQGNFGGNFQAKWLDADAVAKLFIPDASHGTLEQEVCLWQQLRHPNVLKLYGICQAGPSVNLFVCEYASLGSLADYVKEYYDDEKPPLIWKYLYEAALGLEYLHERGVVHGDLRCRNILVGSDGLAKLSNFGLAGFTSKSSSFSNVVWPMRWQAPEVLEGNAPSRESDVYSLGMCILEAESGEVPWCRDNAARTRETKMKWNGSGHGIATYDINDPNSPEPDLYFFDPDHSSFVQSTRELVLQMCRQDPHERPSLASIACKLECLAMEESLGSSQPELVPAFTFDDYLTGE
ncbi:unnamed protein product [Phytophthora fragariaefolia]|uniref:Unnamed protein product n=1 Tax=Phytophthora fragariaefolia TaxID=1490495 RepID=A0A9W7D0T4_9STRA|nr:unnamed protein product [Phytophthora fragariaefolia]